MGEKSYAAPQSGVGFWRARAAGGALLGIAGSLLLSGCLISYDAAPPTIRYMSYYSEPLVFVIDDPPLETPFTVSAAGWADEVLDSCRGTALRVETESGDVLGRVEAEACPGWTLTVNSVGTLDYVEGTLDHVTP